MKLINFKWTPTPLKTGIETVYNGQRLVIVRRKPKEFHAYVDKVRLKDSETKKEAVKKILEAIEVQRRLF